MAKRSSFGYKMRKRLSDITNSQSQSESLFRDENLPEIGTLTEQYVNRLMKENTELVKLLQERDKIIELSTTELQNLRVDIHKLQVQNWSLAQSNSQFLAEINLARNKMKALQHEIMCKNALLKARNSGLEDKNGEVAACRDTVAAENLHKNVNEEAAKPSEPSRRRIVRSKSMGASTAQRSEADKAKDETKRRRSRRQSMRLESQDQREGENLFELEDLQVTMLNNSHEDSTTVSSHNKPNTPRKEEEGEEEDVLARQENCTVHRSSVGRPLRRAVEKIHSYKEVPLKAKMRRSQ